MIPANRYRAQPAGSSMGRQKMTRSISFVGSNGVEQTVTDWSSDGTYPATVASNALVVAGSGTATVTLSLQYSGSAGATGTARLKRNGTQVGSTITMPSDNTYTTSWTGALTSGDTLTATFTKGGYTGLLIAGFIDVVP